MTPDAARTGRLHPTGYALDAAWRPLLKDLGIPAGNVLRRAALPPDLLSRPSVRVTPEDYYRFWNSLEAESSDPEFPLRLCQSIRSESFSPPLFAALCSPNLLTAVQRVAHYKTLVAPMRLGLQEEARAVTIRFEWLHTGLEPPLSLVVAEFLFFVQLARMGTRELVRALSVTSPRVPRSCAAWESFLGCRIRRGSSNAVTFARTDAVRPFLTANESLWQTFEPSLRERQTSLEGSVSVAERVKAVLLEALPGGYGSMTGVAGALGVSKRTLQRQMEAEATTFQQILQQTRQSLAAHYLQRTRISTGEIAFLLGFREANSFYRAFRGWTGRTPDGVRQQAAEARLDKPYRRSTRRTHEHP